MSLESELEQRIPSPVQLTRRLSADKIRFDEINKSLSDINEVGARNRGGKLFLVSFLIIYKENNNSSDESDYRNWTLRQLYGYLDNAWNEIDAIDNAVNALGLNEQFYLEDAPKFSPSSPPTASKHYSSSSASSPQSSPSIRRNASKILVTESSSRSRNSSKKTSSFLAQKNVKGGYVNSSVNVPNVISVSRTGSRLTSPPLSDSERSISSITQRRGLQPSRSSTDLFKNQPNLNSYMYVERGRKTISNNSDKTAGGRRASMYSTQTQPPSVNPPGIIRSHSSSPSTKRSKRKSILQPSDAAKAQPKSAIQTAPLATERLHFRDLRRIDFQFNHLAHEPVLIIRKYCLIISFYPITAIIMSDRVLLSVPRTAQGHSDESDAFVTAFEQYMKEWSDYTKDSFIRQLQASKRQSKRRQAIIVNNDLNSFEFYALEGLLTIIKAYEQQELSSIVTATLGTLKFYKGGRTPPVFIEAKLRSLKSHLLSLKTRVLGYKNTLFEVTEDEEQMALMNLTYLQDRVYLYSYPLSREILSKHEEVEELLQLYLLDFNSIERGVVELENTIRNSEEMFQLQLDTIENRALTAETSITILECSLGLGGFVASAYGMNLDQSNRTINGEFAAVFIVTMGCMILLFYVTFYWFKWCKIFPVTVFKP